MPNLKVNHNGSWVPVKTPHVFHNGAWVVPKAVKVFKDGQWVTAWVAGPPKEYLLDTTFTINHAQKNGIDYHGWARDVAGIDSPAPASLDFKGGGQLRTLESFVQGGIRAFNFQIDGISGAAGSVGIRKPLLITMESEGESVSFATVTENAQVGANEVHWFSQLNGFAKPHVDWLLKFFTAHVGKPTTLRISELDIDPNVLLDTDFTIAQDFKYKGWNPGSTPPPDNLWLNITGGGYLNAFYVTSSNLGLALIELPDAKKGKAMALSIKLTVEDDSITIKTFKKIIKGHVLYPDIHYISDDDLKTLNSFMDRHLGKRASLKIADTTNNPAPFDVLLKTNWTVGGFKYGHSKVENKYLKGGGEFSILQMHSPDSDNPTLEFTLLDLEIPEGEQRPIQVNVKATIGDDSISFTTSKRTLTHDYNSPQWLSDIDHYATKEERIAVRDFIKRHDGQVATLVITDVTNKPST